MKMVPGKYYYGDNEPHWACLTCVVRAMCKQDGCWMTNLEHEICFGCKKSKKCKEACERVEWWWLMEKIDIRYKKTISKYILDNLKETSILYRLSQINPNKKTEWWILDV